MMKKHIKLIAKCLLLALLFSSLASCTKDGDDDYSLPRDKYLGNWRCQDADGAAYIANISSDPSNSTQVIVKSYFGYDGTVTAIVTEGTITVNNQKMQGISVGTYWCEGFGRLTQKGGTYTIFWEKYAANDDETTSTYTKL
jgi:hypothetical protein